MTDIQGLAAMLIFTSACIPLAYYAGREAVLHRLRQIRADNH